jgi:hypothetical protein
MFVRKCTAKYFAEDKRSSRKENNPRCSINYCAINYCAINYCAINYCSINYCVL